MVNRLPSESHHRYSPIQTVCLKSPFKSIWILWDAL